MARGGGAMLRSAVNLSTTTVTLGLAHGEYVRVLVDLLISSRADQPSILPAPDVVLAGAC